MLSSVAFYSPTRQPMIIYHYYQALAPQLPDKLGEMEQLFLAVICGCNAGQFREALHDVYIPRIQRGNTFFAASVLGARGALLRASDDKRSNGNRRED